ncbi:hypothetical protein FRC05_003761 [Tulasnella sp. 425]|nr:hypothetical protein FRC05_003761 [Tulasnella sp. 425]
MDLTDDDDLQGPPRTGWIVAVDGNGTVLGFVPKEADKLGNLPITIEISEALVVRYVPPGTTCGAIEALNARLGYPYSKYPFPTNKATYLSASWFSPVKENEKPLFPNFASLSFGTRSPANEVVGSWANCNGPTQHVMWRVYDDNSILPYWHTEDDDPAIQTYVTRLYTCTLFALNASLGSCD